MIILSHKVTPQPDTQKLFIVFNVVLETAHTKDLWLCLSGSKGGGRRWSESSETDCFHPTAGKEKYFYHCKSEHCDQTHHSNSGDDFLYLKCSSPSVLVRGLNMMTNCFLVFVLLLRCLKTTSTCWKSLTPVTAVGMRKALSLRPPGNTNMHTSTQINSVIHLIHSFDFKDYLDISFTYGAYFDNLKMMKMMKMTTLWCLIANSYCGSPYTCFNSQ